MSVDEELLAKVAASRAHSVDAYEGSAAEVGHPKGQPIIETYPQLEAMIAGAVRDYLKAAPAAPADLRPFAVIDVDAIARGVVKELPLAGIKPRQYGRYTHAVTEGARRALAAAGL